MCGIISCFESAFKINIKQRLMMIKENENSLSVPRFSPSMWSVAISKKKYENDCRCDVNTIQKVQNGLLLCQHS